MCPMGGMLQIEMIAVCFTVGLARIASLQEIRRR